MKGKPTSKVSLRAIAEKAGISTVAASYALRNSPGVSSATRKKVLRIARQMGYVPDARIGSWMAQVRGAKTKELLPLVWFNHHRKEEEAWTKFKFLSPYLEGAQERSRQFGYKLEVMWTCEPGLTSKRISQILNGRGIEGVVVTHFVYDFELDWSHLAAVSIEGSLVTPNLNRIVTDHLFNFQLALAKVKEAGYQRIGVCFSEDFDFATEHSVRAAMTSFNLAVPKANRVEPLFFRWGGRLEPEGTAQAIDWLRKWKPDVIIGLNNHLIEWATAAGLRVPKDVAVVHIANDDDVRDWTGVNSGRREIGATAIDLLVSQIQNRQFGIPAIAHRTLIRGTWAPGHTMPDYWAR